MAPTTIQTADTNYRNACNRLTSAIVQLEQYLPSDAVDVSIRPRELPSTRPRPRVVSVPACPDCAVELQEVDAGDRAGHVRTHIRDQRNDDDVRSTPSSDGGIQRSGVQTSASKRQPSAGIIKILLNTLEEKFDGFTTALSVYTGLLPPEEVPAWEAHMIVWAEYVGELKVNALETIAVLEAAVDSHQRVNNATYKALPSDQGNSVEQALVAQPGDGTASRDETPPPILEDQGALPSRNESLNVQAQTFQPVGGVNAPGPGLEDALGTTDATEGINVNVQHNRGAQIEYDIGSVVNGQPVNKDLMLAILAMNTISAAIEGDLLTAEQELAVEPFNQSNSYLNDLRDYCLDIEKRVKGEYREAGEKCARLDESDESNVTNALQGNSKNFLDRIRALQGDIRRARSSTPSSLSSGSTPPLARDSPQPSFTPSADRTYRPFMKKLEPPVFSGKIEDWPEFRAVWQELLVDHPESVQIQHFRANIPATDAKRVTGVKSMAEMWRRMEKIYGDTDLNIITVKTNLENFTPKANQDYKRIMEVYEAVETAVTQLTNLNAVQYLKDDFGLMSKLVLKLPTADQRQYTQYVTSDAAKVDTASRWDKFWKWLGKLHDSAVQASLMSMCDRTSSAKTSSAGNLKSGISCHTCGGIGHYARTCSSKPKSSASSQSIKVNMAVAKISTKDDYNKYIGDTKKEIGKCPA